MEIVDARPEQTGIIVAIVHLVDNVLSVALSEAKGLRHVAVHNDGGNGNEDGKEGDDKKDSHHGPHAAHVVSG